MRAGVLAMAVDDARVREHIRRALATHGGDLHVLRQLTRAFRLLQAERRDPCAAQDEDLAAAEHYLFARQAVASNVVSLTQMLLIVVGCNAPRRIGQRTLADAGPDTASMPSQDSIGWGVAGAMTGEADREKYLPGSIPPPFRPAFMKSRLSGDRVPTGTIA
jgi:hypothetical protein